MGGRKHTHRYGIHNVCVDCGAPTPEAERVKRKVDETRRFTAAVAAMQGLLAGDNTWEHDSDTLARIAKAHADAIVAALEGDKP
jgi:hypothetical protein